MKLYVITKNFVSQNLRQNHGCLGQTVHYYNNTVRGVRHFGLLFGHWVAIDNTIHRDQFALRCKLALQRPVHNRFVCRLATKIGAVVFVLREGLRPATAWDIFVVIRESVNNSHLTSRTFLL